MTYRPTPTLMPTDRNLIHASTCTTLSSNAAADGQAQPRITFRVTKCEIRRVGEDIAIRFSGHALDVTPKSRSRRLGR